MKKTHCKKCFRTSDIIDMSNCPFCFGGVENIKNAIKLAENEIREWQKFLKIAKAKLAKLKKRANV